MKKYPEDEQTPAKVREKVKEIMKFYDDMDVKKK